jgi:hypothetical protein
MLARLNPKVANNFPKLPADADLTQPVDEDFLDNVRKRGLTSVQAGTEEWRQKGLELRQEQIDTANERLKRYGGVAGLVSRAFDPTNPDQKGDKQALDYYMAAQHKGLTPGQSRVEERFNVRNMEAQGKQYFDANTKEQAQWAKGDIYKAAIEAKDGEAVPNPDSPSGAPVTMNAAYRAQFKQKQENAYRQAQQFLDQKKSILERNGWGKAPAAPAQAPAAAPAAPAPKLRADIPAQIAGGIAEGQTRTVNSPDGPLKLKKVGGKIYQVP